MILYEYWKQKLVANDCSHTYTKSLKELNLWQQELERLRLNIEGTDIFSSKFSVVSQINKEHYSILVASSIHVTVLAYKMSFCHHLQAALMRISSDDQQNHSTS